MWSLLIDPLLATLGILWLVLGIQTVAKYEPEDAPVWRVYAMWLPPSVAFGLILGAWVWGLWNPFFQHVLQQV